MPLAARRARGVWRSASTSRIDRGMAGAINRRACGLRRKTVASMLAARSVEQVARLRIEGPACGAASIIKITRRASAEPVRAIAAQPPPFLFGGRRRVAPASAEPRLESATRLRRCRVASEVLEQTAVGVAERLIMGGRRARACHPLATVRPAANHSADRGGPAAELRGPRRSRPSSTVSSKAT